MKRFATWSAGMLIAASALAAKPELDEEAKAVVAKRNETRDARMQWWRDAKFGMFVHWGVYCVPAGTHRGEKIPGIGEWIMHKARIPCAEYRKYAAQFNPTAFDAEQWVQVMKDAGMKYVVITAKHHDGFAMYHSRHSKWDIDEAAPKYDREPIAELEKACRKHGIRFGLYYSHCWDWNHPGGGTAGESWDKEQQGDSAEYYSTIALPQVREILTRFKPDLIWFDTPLGYVDVNETVKALQLHPDVIVNGRLHGRPTADDGQDYIVHERSVPNHKVDVDWETCATMNGTWGYKSYETSWKEPKLFIQSLARCAGGGGNYLLNVGPDEKGIIPQGSVNVLRQVGQWLEENGETIYGTRGSPFNPIYLKWGACTQNETQNRLYLHVLTPPDDNVIDLPGLKNQINKAYAFKDPSRTCKVSREFETTFIDISGVEQDPVDTIVVAEVEGKPESVIVPARADENGVITIPAYMVDELNRTNVGAHTVKEDPSLPKAVLARDARPGNTYMRVETVHLGKSRTTRATWKHVRVDQPGTYDVVLRYLATDDSGGTPFFVEIDGKRISTKTRATPEQRMASSSLDVGTVNIKEKKTIEVSIGPEDLPRDQQNGQVFWLLCIQLKPVE